MSEQEIYDALRDALRDFDVDPSSVVPTARLENDLGLDSLDRLNAMLGLEARFGASFSGMEQVATVGEAVDLILSHLSEISLIPTEGNAVSPSFKSSGN